MDPKKLNYLKFGFFILTIVLILIIVNKTNLAHEFSLDSVKSLVESAGVYGILVFIGLYVLATVLLLPGTPITLAGGALFGAFWGTAWVVIGATIGSSIAFFVSKWLGKDFCESLMKDKFKTLMKYNNKLEEGGFGIILFLRLIPLFPFNGLNFGLGLTKAKFRDYFLATALGIIPGAAIFAYSGSLLTQDFEPMKVLIAFVLILLLLLVVPFYNRYKK